MAPDQEGLAFRGGGTGEGKGNKQRSVLKPGRKQADMWCWQLDCWNKQHLQNSPKQLVKSGQEGYKIEDESKHQVELCSQPHISKPGRGTGRNVVFGCSQISR